MRLNAARPAAVAADSRTSRSRSNKSKERGQTAVQVVGVGCLGLCSRGPLVEVSPTSTLYEQVTPTTAPSIVDGLDSGAVEAPRCDDRHPFFTMQQKIVCENSGKIDCESIEEYVATGGYQALAKALAEMNPAEVVQAVTRSGLRGRGGAGYPTGVKWATVAKMPGREKYVVCNGDEGDPGAFMDRSVMESDPHRILEGMAIAAYAVGANQGTFTSAEYPGGQPAPKAIQQGKKLGVLGSGISKRLSTSASISALAQRLVCGEETALMASIEGKRDSPTSTAVPAEQGL